MSTGNAQDRYTLRDDQAWDAMMRKRSAMKEAAFLLPFLRKGMSLVDAGCGQGTITLDLAEIVAPGIVNGFDPQAEHVERARALGSERGLRDVFEVGDVYDPPFEASSFDVAFAHMVFMHLPDPEGALRSLMNLVKPGGLIATRDRGSSFHFEGGNTLAMGRVIEIIVATTNAGSGSPYGMAVGEVMHRLCREAGMEVVQLTASLDIQLPSSREYVLAGAFGRRALEAGVTTESEVDELGREWALWAADPDAYMALDHYEVVARKPA